MKAMILAAGFGARLRPLTETTPKPLIEIGGKPLIEYTLNAVYKAGIKEVIINLHHLGGKIQDKLGDGSRYGLTLRYSPETVIRGTGGALLQARAFLDEPFYLINSDILFDLDLTLLPPLLSERQAHAVMVLAAPGPDQPAPANIYLDSRGNVRSLFTAVRGTVPYIFTGIQFLTPDALRYIPDQLDQPSTTLHMYPGMINDKRRIAGYVHAGLWMDIGNPTSLEQAQRLFRT